MPPLRIAPGVAAQMGAQKMGYFSRAEFRTGLSELGASSLAQLRKVLPTLATEVRPARQRGPPPPHPPARPAHFIAAAQPAVCCLDSLERKLFPSESQPWCPADLALPAPAQAPRRCGTRTRWSSSTTSPSASALR